MDNKNVRDDNIFPVCVNCYFDNFYISDKEFMAQYNGLSSGYFEGLYRKYNHDPDVLYSLLSSKQLSKLKNNFDYKIKFNEILFSEKSKIDYDQFVLLYEVFCWNILYKKMLADELSEQKENNADNLEQDKINKRYNLQNEIMKTAFYKNLFDELVYHLVEFKNDEDVIKFLFEKTFVSSDDENNKDKFIELEKEILDCVKQVNENQYPIICIANADNVDVAKNKDKYNQYAFVQWKKWNLFPEFEKAHEKKLPDVKLDDVLSVGDDKIFGKEEIKSIKDDKPQETKKLLSQDIDAYLVEENVGYENFFALIDYYLDFCSKERNWQAYSANRELFVAKKYYLWRLISSHLKVIFQNDKRDDFMNKFNDKFIKKGYIENENEAEKAAIVNIIELSSTVQYGKIMTYNGDRYKLNNNDIYRNLLDNSQSDCLTCLKENLFPKYWVDVIKNELEYKNLCKAIIFKKDTSALDAKDLSLIFEVFLFNVLYKKISNINLAKDNNEINKDLQNIWYDKIENSILNQGLFEKFRRNIVNFKDEDDVIKFLYKETFGIKDVDDKEILSTMKKEILKCVEVLKNNKAPLVFFTDNTFVKEKYSSEKYKPCRIFVWERKDNLPELREKTTMSLKENIKDVLCAFDDYIFFGIDNKKDKNDIELPIENKTDEKSFIEEQNKKQNDNLLLYTEFSENKNITINSNIENKKMDYLLLFESIGDYLNEFNFDLDDEIAVSENKDKNDQLTPEQKVNNNFIDLIEYYCSFCARKEELPAENKDYERHQLFNTKKKYLFGFIENKLRIIRDNRDINNNAAEDFMTKFNSKFIENHKIKANNEAEKKEIANFINLLKHNGLYPQDKSYFVIFGDEIYPTSIKYTATIPNLDIFFEIDEDKCTVKLKSEEFRSAIYNILNESSEIDRTELFKNFYNRVMKSENLSPEQKQERLNKIMPQLLKFISIYGLLDKTKMDHNNDDPICYYVDFDRFDELTDLATPVDTYVEKLWVDISYNSVDYCPSNNSQCFTDYIKILGVIKNMVSDKKLTLREDNVQVIKSLIKKFLLVGASFANSLKKKYLQAFFEKTNVNDITQSDSFKRLTLAFEIVSRLVGENKEHEVKKFFDDEIKKLFGLDGLQNSLLGFIDPNSECKKIKFCLNEDKNKDDMINKFVDSFKDAIEATKISGNLDSIEKVFTETKPDFDLAMLICERIFDEIMVQKAKEDYPYIFYNECRGHFIYVIDLLSSLLSSNHFELDSEEKQKRVYILYSKIISYSKKEDDVKNQISSLEDQIKNKIYGESKFNLVKYYYNSISMSRYYDSHNFEKRGDEIAIVDKPRRSKESYLSSNTLLTELFKFKHLSDIVNSDKDFFANFICEIVFHIESEDYKGSENDKNEFYGIYSIKSLTGYKSFQDGDLYLYQLSKFDKQKQREFIFDTDLFLEISNGCLDSCLNANNNLDKFLFQSNFTFVLPIDEITADNVNGAFQAYSQKLNENFKDKEGDKDKDGKYQKLKDDFLGLFAKALIGHCELILSDEQYHKGKNKDELKNDYIKTIAMFCRDKETKIIRSVLENCTRTAEEQKNKFIKPYAIIEALLNDDNFKLDADKAKLMINWFSKYNVDELGIELKEYDNLKAIINKLYNELKSDEVNLDDDNLIQSGKDMINCYELILMHSKDGNQRDELKDGYIKTIATLLKIIKWISFALITIAGLILILNSFVHMFSLSLVLSIPLILACIIFDMALFENGRKILKSILKCIFCRHTETNNYIGKNNYQGNESLISSNQNEIFNSNNDIKLESQLKTNEKK